MWWEDRSEATSTSRMRTKEPRTLREHRSCGAEILGGHRTTKGKSERGACQLLCPSPGPCHLVLLEGVFAPSTFTTDPRGQPR